MGTITKIPFDLADKEGWLKIRGQLVEEGRLGGSDIGTAVGDNPYKSPYALWCEMVGLYEPEDISDKEAIKQGVMFEDAVAKRFAKEMGIEVEEVPYMFINSDAPHLFATPDRLCKDGESGLECKTAKDIVMKKYPRGDFPQQYFDQCCCYLKVTERKRWYIAILIYGVGFNKYLMTTIKEEADRFNLLKDKIEGSQILTDEESKEWQEKWNRLEAVYYVDQETLDSVELAAANFVSRVIAGRQGDVNAWPNEEIDGSESTEKVLKAIHAKYDDGSIVTFDDADSLGIAEGDNEYIGPKGSVVCSLVRQRLEYDKLITQMTAERDEIDNRMMELMGKKEKFIVPGCSVTYKMGTAKKYGSVAAIEQYFAARKEQIPEGMITKSVPTRGIRFYPSRKKKKASN